MPTKQAEIIRNIYSDVQYIKKTLDGNGHEGLCKVVERHEKEFNMLEGRNKLITAVLGSGWLLSLIGLTVAIIN